jgi:hypothetical protein
MASPAAPTPSFPLRAASDLAAYVTSHRALFHTVAFEVKMSICNIAVWQHVLDFLGFPPCAIALKKKTQIWSSGLSNNMSSRNKKDAWSNMLSRELRQELKDKWYVAHKFSSRVPMILSRIKPYIASLHSNTAPVIIPTQASRIYILVSSANSFSECAMTYCPSRRPLPMRILFLPPKCLTSSNSPTLSRHIAPFLRPRPLSRRRKYLA